MTPTMQAQFAAIEMQVELLRVQLQALKHALTERPTAAISLPERCVSVDPTQCGLQNDDAQISRASFADMNAWVCSGCDYRSATDHKEM